MWNEIIKLFSLYLDLLHWEKNLYINLLLWRRNYTASFIAVC